MIRIDMLKKIYIVAMMLCMNQSINTCMAQDNDIKAFLFLSIFCEESDFCFEGSAQRIMDFQSNYETFSYECTKPLVIPIDTFFCDSLKSYEKYTIQLFKIHRNSFIPTYYILRVVSCDTYRFSFSEELWIRICGYRESDLKVFFDALRRQGLKKKEISNIIALWCNSDEMFREIDWDCLMEGYNKKNTHTSCYKSGSNIYYKARHGGREDDIYAVFSKKPIAGTLIEFD